MALNLKHILVLWGCDRGMPITISLFTYINDLQGYLAIENNGVHIGYIPMLPLLYADDVVIFANSSAELQNELNNLFELCNRLIYID